MNLINRSIKKKIKKENGAHSFSQGSVQCVGAVQRIFYEMIQDHNKM